MKKCLLLFILIGLALSMYAQVSKTVALATAGTLSSTLTIDELNTVSSLTLTGTIDARDFKTMRDLMPKLADINLSGVAVAAYTGSGGTASSWNNTYGANAIPESAFRNSSGQGKTSLKSFVLPSSVTMISTCAFYSCSGLSSIILESSITTIGESAFNSCNSLTSIAIPSSVTSIGNYAFSYCDKLASVIVSRSVPLDLSTYYSVFYGVNNTTCTLNVPYGTASLYAVANQWKDFKNIVGNSNGFIVGAVSASIGAVAGSTASVAINANVEWTANSNQTWLTVSPASGSGNGTLVFTAQTANSSVVTRTATITVSATGNESQTIMVRQDGSNTPLNITAGTLSTAFSSAELASVVSLTLKGTIDARDFKTMRDLMPLLANVDLSGASIMAYTGSEGTTSWNQTYVDNAIPENAFRNSSGQANTSLKSIVLPSSATLISRYAFNSCSGLSSVTIPSSVTTISESAFYSCSSLTAVTIPSLVTTIGESAFNACSSLTSVAIPSSVTKIGYYAFSYCSKLVSITTGMVIPLDLSPYYGVFNGVDKISCILNVPYGTASLYAKADQWKDFKNIVGNSNGFIVGAVTASVGASAGSTVSVPVNANVAWTASSNQTWLAVSPTLGSGNGTLVFTTQTANSSVATRTAIVTVSASGNESQAIVVRQDGSNSPINITAGTLSTAFSSAELASVVSLTLKGTIDARDFKTMRDLMPLLAKVDISAASIVAYTGSEGTSYYSNTTYPANTVPEYAFFNNSSYKGKISLTSFVSPSSVTAFGSNAFYGCTGLINVSFPSSLTTIAANAFNSCSNLTSGTLPSTVTSIGEYAFQSCSSLTTVTIPSSVTKIGYNAFSSCSKLVSITSEMITPLDISSSYGVFYGVDKTSCVLNVPYGTSSLYAKADQWKDFKNIVGGSNGFILDAVSLNVGTAANSTVSVKVNANVAWAASSNQSWLTVSPNSGLGSETLVFTTQTANAAVATRVATVTVSATGYKSQTIVVAQDGVSLSVTAGKLATTLTPAELALLTKLIITGTIDARDFRIMRDLMPNLTQIDLSGASIVAYTGNEGTSYYSATYAANEVPESALSYNSGQGRSQITSFVFPPSVTAIKQNAFSGCAGLIGISLPPMVTAIGERAFNSCTNLTSVAIPSSVTKIGNYAFSSCSKLGSITAGRSIPPDLSSSYSVFEGVDKTTCTLNVPYGTALLYAAANQWKDFTHIVGAGNGFNLSAATTTIGAAQNSTVTVALNANVTWTASSKQDWLTVSPGSGSGNETLVFTAQVANSSVATRTATVTVSATGCESQMIVVRQDGSSTPLKVVAGTLATMFTPEELASIVKLTLTGTIDARDFKTMRDQMPMLVHVDLSGANIVAYTGNEGTSDYYGTNYAANTIPEYAFRNNNGQGKTSLTSFVFPSSTTAVKQYAFFGCSGLSSIIIPSLVTTIGENAFTSCSKLTSLTIPSSVTKIGNYAFSSCNKLGSITAGRSIPPDLSSSYSVFEGVDKTTCTLNVPYGTALLYATANQWKDFKNIVGAGNGFNLSAVTANVRAAAGSTASATVNANVAWTTSSNQSWLKISPASGSSTSLLTFTADSNPSVAPRIATVTVSSTGYESQIIVVKQDGSSAPLNITAGTLSTVLTSDELATVINLTLTGTIDARDFKTMRDLMPMLAQVDLSGASIVAYTGDEGTSFNGYTTYNANEVPQYAFRNNNGQGKSLTSFVFPSSVKAINQQAFYGCSGLTTITIPRLVTIIGDYAFYGCRGLTSVAIPSSVTKIGESAFYECSGLTSVAIPSSVTNIGSSVFSYCGKLVSITVGESIPPDLSTSYSVFYGVDKTACTLNVPYGTVSLYAAANQWKDFTHIVGAGNGFNLSAVTTSIGAVSGSTASITVNANVAWAASSSQGWLKVSPASGSSTSLLTFTADSNPSVAPRLATVTVSSTGYESQSIGVKQDGSSAPLNITAGTLVTALTPDELATVIKLTLTGTIDARDFKTMRDLMPNLAQIDLSGASIVAYTGSEGTVGTSSTYAANEVPQYAFGDFDGDGRGKISLTSFVFPSSATVINQYAFFRCTGLTSVTFSSSLTTIGKNAFESCKFTSVVIPTTVTTLGNYSFAWCDKLSSVTIPSSVTVIGIGAFQSCASLISISIPISVTIIGGFAFDSCSSLVSATIPSSVTAIGEGAFSSCVSLISISIPSSVTTISAFTFSNCSKLTSISIPSTVTAIGSAAFQECSSLTSVTIPSSVTKIESFAFYYCSKLASITVGGSIPPDLSATSYVFSGVDKTTCILNVPYGTASLYAAANQWKDFTHIEGASNGFNLSATTASLEAASGSTASVNVNANVNWTASSTQDWLAVSPISGSSNGKLVFTAQMNNPSLAPRTATITVSATGYESQSIVVRQDGSSTPLNITAGTLSTALSADELAMVVKLTLTGTIDARDFKTMRDLMPLLAELDLSASTIIAYSGTEGSSFFNNNMNYPANAIPECAFVNTNCRGKASLTSVKLPSSLTEIDTWAFAYCLGLDVVSIPSSVTSIGDGAFINCNSSRFTTLSIPTSVTSIGSYAFKYCTNLTSITVAWSIPLDLSSSTDVFYGVDKTTCILNVPYGTTSVYAAANQWKDFTHIVAPSNPTSVSWLTTADLKIYPNPFSGPVTIDLGENADEAEMAVYSIQGALLLQQKLEETKSVFDLHGLVPGSYLIKVSVGNTTQSKILIKK